MPHASSEQAMVAHEVDDHQATFACCGAQATAQLLGEDDRRLGWSQHHHAVDGWQVDTLIEEIDGTQRLEPA